MNHRVRRCLRALCASSARHPIGWLLVTLFASAPAVMALRDLAIDTDLTRLLPTTSRAVRNTLQLDSLVGGTSYVAVLLEGDDRASLVQAVETTAERIRRLPRVSSVEYRYPTEFIARYRYLLIPHHYLERIPGLMLGHSEADGEEPEAYDDRQALREIRAQLDHYGNRPQYHQTPDGRVMGMFIRTERGVTSLTVSRQVFGDIERLTRQAAQEFGLTAEVRGSLRNKIDAYDVIMADLRRAGLVTASAILLALVVSFRALRPVPVVVYPLSLGLVWAFAVVPVTIGDLNLITAFLLIVMFGMGIDYAIHLVKRFQQELVAHPPADALWHTYRSTGRSVLVSGATTGVALFVLAASDFRGFSEFGAVGGLAVTTVLLAMGTVMPAALVAGHRWKLVRPQRPSQRSRSLVPGRTSALVLGAATLAGLAFMISRLEFDYDFSNFNVTVRRVATVQGTVYTTNRSPGAVYVVPDLRTLDTALATLEARRGEPESTIGRVASVRDFAPSPEDAAARLDFLRRLRHQTRGLRSLFIGDAALRRMARDLRSWKAPERPPTVDEIPDVLQAGLRTQDGPEGFLIAVYPNVERRHGRNAMAFTEELYGLDMPAGVRGPVGETPVVAEILWLVTSEGPWLIGAVLLSVFTIVLVHRRSLPEAGWILLPLVAGVVLALGLMAVAGWKLNFFNLVAIPALLGMGVDHGVHYYQRWLEHGRDVGATHRELLGPLTACTVTTMMGYAGMVFASHPGLRSIGVVTCLGLACTWMTSLVLLPGILHWRHPLGAGGGNPTATGREG